MRRVVAVLLGVALLSCQQQQTAAKLPTGALGPIASEAKGANAADLGDVQFETFLTRLDLKTAFGARADEIADQLRKTRAAVAAARAAGAVAAGPHRASVQSGAAGTFSVPLFASTFAGLLDMFTKQSGSYTVPGKPYESTEDGATTRTTTTLKTTDTFTGSGSVVTYTMQWSYRMTTVDKASGQTILDSTDDRSMTGTIDVCPNGNGIVTASLDADAVAGATKLASGKGTQERSESKSTNKFSGTVSDAAALQSVKQDFTEKASWTTATATGSYDTNISATHAANTSGGFLGGLDTGSFTGTFNSTGDVAGVDVGKATAWVLDLDAWAMDEAFQSAQKLWRNGRCVMVTVSDYGAETPLEVGDQTKSQHDERVDPGSETKFGVSTKHRFAGALSQSVVASLSGDKTLEPNKLDSVPGQLTFTAPKEDDKKATATLRSTSKRGIGTLVLDFHTGGGLTLSITGTVTGTQGFGAGFGVAQWSDKVAMGPFTFQKGPQDAFVAMGTWVSDVHQETNYGPYSIVCDGHETGPAQLVARLETRGSSTVWVIDPRNSVAASGPGTMDCVTSAPGSSTKSTNPSDGSSAGLFLRALGEIVVPQDGGTISVRGQSSVGGQWQAQGTVTATTKK